MKTKALRDGLAFLVIDGAVDIDSVELELGKGVVDECTARFGHNAVALKSFGEPITGPTDLVLPIDTVVSDDAGNLATVPDTGYKSGGICKLFLGCLNKMP